MSDFKGTKRPRASRQLLPSKDHERTQSGLQRAQAGGSEKPPARTQAADQTSRSGVDGLASNRMAPDAAEAVALPAPATIRPEPVAGTEPVEQVFLTIAEVARLLRMSERTIRRRIKDGTIRKAPVSGRLVRIGARELTRLAETKHSPKPSESSS